MTEQEINTQGFKLVDLLSVKEVTQDKAKEPEKELIGINKVVNLGKVNNLVTTQSDAYGNTIAKYAQINGKEVGFDQGNYKALLNLSVEILKKDKIAKITDVEFIEDGCFKWVVGIYKENRATVELMTFIKSHIDANLSNITFYFKIEALGIEGPFNVGLIEIISFSQESFSKEYTSHGLKNPLNNDELNKNYGDFIDKPLASVTINAVKEKAEKIARRNVYLSLNAIKCFLIRESVQSHIQIFDVDFNHHNSSFSKYLTKLNREDSGFNLTLNRNYGAAPVVINHEVLSQLNKSGLGIVSEFLRKERDTELQHKIEDSINHFGEIISTRNLHERIVKIISFFEGIIVPKSNTKAKGQTYLNNNILPHLTTSNIEEYKSTIRRFYDVRDKYLHNRLELPIDIQDLMEIENLGLTFLLKLIELSSRLTTIDDIISHYSIKY